MTTAHVKLNKGTKTGADKAAENLPALTRAYGRALRAAGRRAAAKMRQTETITAAGNDLPPNWTPPPAGSLIDQQELADDTQAKTAKLHKQMLTASAQSALQPFDISFDIRAPTSQVILDAVAARIQGTITSAIEEQITEAIQNGYANGDSVDRVSRAITTATDKISKVRADMLARTDLNALSNAGSLLGATTADAASTKTWLATEDERTRETHSEADGQTVGINDVFTVGGESAQYPGDPNLSWEESANCRCTVVYGQPLTASVAFERFRDHLWEGDFRYDIHRKEPDALVETEHNAVTSGGNMPAIDVATLTHEERDALSAQLAEPLTPEAARLVEVRSALASGGFADAFDDEQLAAIIIVSEALSISPNAPVLRASLTNFALLAAAVGGTPWSATLCVAGMPTVDSGIKRLLSVDSGGWLPLPLPLALMDDSPHADVSTKSPICGRIDSISVAGNAYQASGVFFDDSDDPEVAAAGSKAAALVTEMRRMGVSCDLVDCEWDMMVYDASSVTGLADAIEEALDEANDPIGDIDAPGGPATEVDLSDIADSDDIEYIMVAKQWTIGGATIVPIQALTDSTITIVASAFQGAAEWRSETEFALPALTAAAAGLVPLEPPVDWFNDPELDGPTPLTVTDEGRVYGHLATWDTCHTGLPGCVPPPRSPTGYMNFHLGEIKAEGGERVSVGTLSFDKPHAPHRLNADRTVAHYDDTTTAGAHVRAGEDQFGIWLAGALNPRLSAEDARVLMAAPPSGDWRQVRQGEGRDLVGALAVNVPGFPVPRERKGLSLQASASCEPCEESFARELQVLAASADGIEGLAELVA